MFCYYINIIASNLAIDNNLYKNINDINQRQIWVWNHFKYLNLKKITRRPKLATAKPESPFQKGDGE